MSVSEEDSTTNLDGTSSMKYALTVYHINMCIIVYYWICML